MVRKLFTNQCVMCSADFETSVRTSIFCKPQCKEEYNYDSLAPGTSFNRVRFIVLNRDKFTCQYCGSNPRNTEGCVLEVDHITPRFNKGDNELNNLITACRKCNAGKSTMTIDPPVKDADQAQAEVQ